MDFSSCRSRSRRAEPDLSQRALYNCPPGSRMAPSINHPTRVESGRGEPTAFGDLEKILPEAMIPVVEGYKDYLPPRGVRRTIEKLLSSLPKHYISGLESVVMTNAGAVGRGKTTRYGDWKYNLRDCRGLYYGQPTNGKPWIEIVVDNIIPDWPQWVLRVPVNAGSAIRSNSFPRGRPPSECYCWLNRSGRGVSS